MAKIKVTRRQVEAARLEEAAFKSAGLKPDPMVSLLARTRLPVSAADKAVIQDVVARHTPRVVERVRVDTDAERHISDTSHFERADSPEVERLSPSRYVDRPFPREGA